MLGLIGLKVGMSRYFTEDGLSIPVTLIRVTNNRVVQVKNKLRDGYSAIQLTFGEAEGRFSNEEAVEKEIIESGSRLAKRGRYLSLPQQGHFKRHNCPLGKIIKEFRVDEEEIAQFEGGQELSLSLFAAINCVDISGKSKGKGYAGPIKRWNFRSQRASHGNSLSHRAPGSTGQNQTPGRVFAGKKMAGRMGSERVTKKGLSVIHVDTENSLLIVKGAVPGSTGGLVMIKPSQGNAGLVIGERG